MNLLRRFLRSGNGVLHLHQKNLFQQSALAFDHFFFWSIFFYRAFNIFLEVLDHCICLLVYLARFAQLLAKFLRSGQRPPHLVMIQDISFQDISSGTRAQSTDSASHQALSYNTYFAASHLFSPCGRPVITVFFCGNRLIRLLTKGTRVLLTRQEERNKGEPTDNCAHQYDCNATYISQNRSFLTGLPRSGQYMTHLVETLVHKQAFTCVNSPPSCQKCNSVCAVSKTCSFHADAQSSPYFSAAISCNDYKIT